MTTAGVSVIIRIFGLLALLWGTSAWAGIGDELRGTFDEMSNTSSAQEFATVDRKGYWGGSYQMRSRVMNLQWGQAQLPSAKAGCGGINMTGGSYSFVNTDQIIQLFRQVASNAKGYAFQLAMDAACPGCTKWMNEFQAKIQAMTSHTANSCQLAQGIVNVAADALTPAGMSARVNRAQVDSGLQAAYGNTTKDIWAALNFPMENGKPWKTPLEQEKETDPVEFTMKLGNVLWNAMVWADQSDKFTALKSGSAGKETDYELMQNIVSMVDTVVIIEAKDDRGLDTFGEQKIPNISDMSLERLVLSPVGAKIKTYDCVNHPGDVSAVGLPAKVKDGGICAISSENTTDVELKYGGLATQLITSFNGDGATVGMLESLAYHKGLVAPDPNTLKYMRAYDPIVVETARLYARHGLLEKGKSVIEKYGNRIALDTVKSMVDGYLSQALLVLGQSDLKQKSYVGAQMERIVEAKQRINDEYKALLKRKDVFASLGNAADELRDAKEAAKKVAPKILPANIGGK